MAYSTEKGYTGDGSTTDYTITFPFLDKNDIKAKVAGNTTTAFSVTGTLLSFDTAPANNDSIVIYRDTDIDQTNVLFQVGASIRAQDLNSNDKQFLYAIQENESNTGTTADLTTGQKNHINVNTVNNWLINDNVISNAMMLNNSVDSAEIVAGSVDLVHMSSDSVDEDNLKISNTGTNGQFLQKQSGNAGGLTWATPAYYTHPNHTGEVTSSGDGATTITDNVVDEANLKISNAGSNGQYLQKQSGNTGGLTWATIATQGIVGYASTNDSTARTFSADTWSDVGLSISYTPSQSSSTILLNAYLNLWGGSQQASNVTNDGRFKFRLLEGSTVIGEVQQIDFGKGVTSTYIHYGTVKEWQFNFFQEYDNGNTNAKTFKIQVYEDSGELKQNTNDGLSMLTVMEIVP